MKFLNKNFLLIVIICFFGFIGSVDATSNPYGKYQDLYGVKTVRCTWYAWQQAYDNAGVALPGWGNAQEWYNSAAMAGYSVGKEARANSIAVWSSSDSYGHVAYVVSVDAGGEYMTVNEGGIPTLENEGIVIGSKLSTSASNLIGFIYLNDAPKSPGDSTSSSSSSESNNSSKKESSNSNLSELKIDVEGFYFDPEIMEYNLEVNYDTKIITIRAMAEDTLAIVTGAGEKALRVGENNYSILITAEDGTTKEYKINVIRNAKATEEATEMAKDNENENKSNNKILIMIIVVVIVIFTLGIILLMKYRKKKIKK